MVASLVLLSFVYLFSFLLGSVPCKIFKYPQSGMDAFNGNAEHYFLFRSSILLFGNFFRSGRGYSQLDPPLSGMGILPLF